MKVETKYFGEIEVSEDRIIDFPQGVPGFQDQKQFVLLDLEDSPVFHVLQSVTNIKAAFIVANPYHFRKDYEFNLDDGMLEVLEIEKEEDVAVYVILSIREPFEKSTMNLQAPVVVNQTKRKGKQYIMNNSGYAIRTPVIETDASSVKEG